MFEQAVRRIFANVIDTGYRHIRKPVLVYGRITAASAIGADNWVYSVKLLTSGLIVDSTTPEIPGVKSKVEVSVGDTVAVMLLYGGETPYIVGEALI